VYHQPNSAGDFRHNLFACCNSVSDGLLAWLCAPCYAYCAAQDADEGTCTAILNCLLYPWCLCCLRGSIREKRGISVSGSDLKPVFFLRYIFLSKLKFFHFAIKGQLLWRLVCHVLLPVLRGDSDAPRVHWLSLISSRTKLDFL
jgi:hypothetical protein